MPTEENFSNPRYRNIIQIIFMWLSALPIVAMEPHAPRDRRPDRRQRLSTTGVLGYLAVLAALLALLTAPIVTGTSIALAGLTVALLRGIDRPNRSETPPSERTTPTVTSDTVTE
jgi:hypothetical protein